MIVLGVLILAGVVVNVAVTLVVCAHLNRNGKQYPSPAPGWMTEKAEDAIVLSPREQAFKDAYDAEARRLERDPMIGLS